MRVFTLVILTVLAVAAPARAATVDVDFRGDRRRGYDVIVFKAAPGERNVLTGNGPFVDDDGATPAPDVYTGTGQERAVLRDAPDRHPRGPAHGTRRRDDPGLCWPATTSSTPPAGTRRPSAAGRAPTKTSTSTARTFVAEADCETVDTDAGEGRFSARPAKRDGGLLHVPASDIDDVFRTVLKLRGQAALDHAIHSLGREDVLDHHDPGADRAGPVAEARGHDPQVAGRQRE